MRCVEMHDWPACEKPATDTFLAAVSTSALGSMISGALLPSSRPTFLRGGAGADAPSDLGRAGERDERDVGMVDDRVADGAAAAGHDVEVAGREPALVEQHAARA